mmetsp:Transcript_2672/g.8020  ORF Transcript_2672/g.8020 Transcript_2672/m.8020 type:complete len:205 (-) Transcript_2672:13-627(-)
MLASSAETTRHASPRISRACRTPRDTCDDMPVSTRHTRPAHASLTSLCGVWPTMSLATLRVSSVSVNSAHRSVGTASSQGAERLRPQTWESSLSAYGESGYGSRSAPSIGGGCCETQRFNRSSVNVQTSSSSQGSPRSHRFAARFSAPSDFSVASAGRCAWTKHESPTMAAQRQSSASSLASAPPGAQAATRSAPNASRWDGWT